MVPWYFFSLRLLVVRLLISMTPVVGLIVMSAMLVRGAVDILLAPVYKILPMRATHSIAGMMSDVLSLSGFAISIVLVIPRSVERSSWSSVRISLPPSHV